MVEPRHQTLLHQLLVKQQFNTTCKPKISVNAPMMSMKLMTVLPNNNMEPAISYDIAKHI